jgi:PAS domain S-box-containing protein
VSSVQHFSLDALGRDVQSLAEIDAFTWPLLEGYMKTREAQILTDQEQLRRALSAALESQSQELLVKNHAINTSINGIMLADLSGTVTWVNASFLSLCGYATPQELIGSHIGNFWPGEDARRVLEVLPRTGGWRGEQMARRKDESTFTVELSESLIRNEDGTAIGIMTSFVDITERKRLQAQVLQGQKMDALGLLAGGIFLHETTHALGGGCAGSAGAGMSGMAKMSTSRAASGTSVNKVSPDQYATRGP